MDIGARIQQLEDLLREAKSMPLSSSVLVNREEALEVVGAMREELPEEIKQARWVVKDREELLDKARRDAEALVEKARAEQIRLASQEEVAAKAQEESERILAEAKERAREIRLEADDYVDGKLAQFEIALQKVKELLWATQSGLSSAQSGMDRTIDSVRRGREKLSGIAHPAQALAPEEDEAMAEEGGV